MGVYSSAKQQFERLKATRTPEWADGKVAQRGPRGPKLNYRLSVLLRRGQDLGTRLLAQTPLQCDLEPFDSYDGRA